MYLTSDKKKEFFKTYGKSETDTGSQEAQVAMFTDRINHLTEHLKLKKKDVATRRALVLLVGKRRRSLEYIKMRDIDRYREIIKKLGIRK
jgi:small subunit ribosomal protein S15